MAWERSAGIQRALSQGVFFFYATSDNGILTIFYQNCEGILGFMWMRWGCRDTGSVYLWFQYVTGLLGILEASIIRFLAKLLMDKFNSCVGKSGSPRRFVEELGGPRGLKHEPITLTGHSVTPATPQKDVLRLKNHW